MIQKTNNLSLKTFEFIENFNPNYIGIYFSLFLHLFILLLAIGLPDFFKPKQIVLPNIIPIEILNVSEMTNLTDLEEKKISKDIIEKKVMEQKKFNSSENLEIKKIELQKKPKELKNIVSDDNSEIVKNKSQEVNMDLKKIDKNLNKEINSTSNNIETFETKKIKPKLKPKEKNNFIENNTDVELTASQETDKKISVIEPKPQLKPDPDINIASVLKDLRNEKSNNVIENEPSDKEDKIVNETDINNEKNLVLSISEIDLLRQQLSSCWNAPAGAVIKKGMKVTISSKIQKNQRVIENSVRLVSTNIPKNNPFYVQITESAMRTLLNPECSPLKLPKDKYNLWKNLTITFDYSIMKGYS